MKRLGPIARDIADDLRTRPGRAALSLMALGIGMTALTILLAILGGLDRRARKIISELGADVVAVVSASATGHGPRPALSVRQLEVLRANLPQAAVSGVRIHENVSLRGDAFARVVAADERLLETRPWEVINGRFIDAQDLRGRARVAVASEGLARVLQLGPGSLVTLGDIPFQIIGIVRADSGALETEATIPALTVPERTIWVPRTVEPAWRASGAVDLDALDAVFVRPFNSLGRPADTVRLVEQLLRQPDTRPGEFEVITPESLLARLRRLQRAIRFTAGSVAALCLLLGGATLSSLLVANVRDRIPEIGLRRALGAEPSDIAALFLAEAAALTSVSALLGSALGTIALVAVRANLPIEPRLDALTLSIPLLLAVPLGALFSVGPARAAARIAPAEALRNE